MTRESKKESSDGFEKLSKDKHYITSDDSVYKHCMIGDPCYQVFHNFDYIMKFNN